MKAILVIFKTLVPPAFNYEAKALIVVTQTLIFQIAMLSFLVASIPSVEAYFSSSAFF